jgi:hypothetical protein
MEMDGDGWGWMGMDGYLQMVLSFELGRKEEEEKRNYQGA